MLLRNLTTQPPQPLPCLTATLSLPSPSPSLLPPLTAPQVRTQCHALKDRVVEVRKAKAKAQAAKMAEWAAAQAASHPSSAPFFISKVDADGDGTTLNAAVDAFEKAR